jgi:hypothetical protein
VREKKFGSQAVRIPPAVPTALIEQKERRLGGKKEAALAGEIDESLVS